MRENTPKTKWTSEFTKKNIVAIKSNKPINIKKFELSAGFIGFKGLLVLIGL